MRKIQINLKWLNSYEITLESIEEMRGKMGMVYDAIPFSSKKPEKDCLVLSLLPLCQMFKERNGFKAGFYLNCIGNDCVVSQKHDYETVESFLTQASLMTMDKLIPAECKLIDPNTGYAYCPSNQYESIHHQVNEYKVESEFSRSKKRGSGSKKRFSGVWKRVSGIFK